MIDLFCGLSARAARAQGLGGRVRDEEECPVERVALAVGRAAAPVVCDAEGESVGWDAEIGHGLAVGDAMAA